MKNSDMAEADFPDIGPGSDIPSFDPLAKLKDDFRSLDPSHQREFTEWLHGGPSEGIKSNDIERFEAVRSRGEEGPATSSAVDRTLVGRPLENANDQVASLVEALHKKNVLEADLVNKRNSLSRNLKDTKKMLENANVRKGEMLSKLEKAETKLSASEEMCKELTIQVRNLLDELKDREIQIHNMTESAQRRQVEFEEQLADLREQNARLLRQQAQPRQEFALLQEQLVDSREENAVLSQQIEDITGRNQMFINWLNNARRYLRQGEPPLAQPFDLPEAEVIPHILE